MDFLVFGATGRTGSAFVRQALAGGHGVAALARSSGKGLPAGVAVTQGDVLDDDAVARAVRSEHTLVVTLGGVDSLTTGCDNVVRAAVATGARRLLGVVGAGVLQANATHQRHEMPDYPERFREIGGAHQAFHAAVKGSPLDWTLVCTPRIVDGPRTGAFVTRADYLPDGSGAVSTEDIAALLLEEAIAPRFLRSRVGMNGGVAR